jgi:hypothetical protein
VIKSRTLHFLSALLVIGIFVLAYLGQRPLCIDSKLVEKIDMVGDNESAAAYSCRLKKTVDYDQNLAVETKKISDRIFPLEKFFAEFGDLKNTPQILWLKNSPKTFQVRGRQLNIGTELLDKPLVLEKEIAKTWVKEHLPQNMTDDILLVESLAELVLFSAGGDSTEDHPEARWPQVLKSFSAYCSSSFRWPEHREACEQAAVENPQLLDQLTPYSLQPLLSQSVLQAYLQMPPNNRFQFWKDFGSDRLVWRSQIPKVQSWGANEWTQISQDIDNFSQKFPSELANLVDTELKKRGFFSSRSKAFFDIVFLLPEQDDLQPRLIEKIIKASQKNNKMIVAAEDSMRIWLMPTNEFLTKSMLQSYRAQRAVWMKCQQPDLNELKNLANQFERVLVLSDCQKNLDINFESYVSGGIENFASENQSVAFVQIHLPSLLQGLKKADVNPIPLLGKQDWRNPFFQGVGWQGATWVDRLKAYRSRSVIEAIEMYRN